MTATGAMQATLESTALSVHEKPRHLVNITGTTTATATSFSQVPYNPLTPALVRVPSTTNFRFLDIHPLFQRRQAPPSPPSSLDKLPLFNSSQDTVKALSTTPGVAVADFGAEKKSEDLGQGLAAERLQRTGNHVSIHISHDLAAAVLNNRPPSPISPRSSLRPSSRQRLVSDKPECLNLTASDNRPIRPRHVPIRIPAFAQPFTNFPPTPVSSTSTTPRESFKTSHSCEPAATDMSRPTLNGGRANPFDAGPPTSAAPTPPNTTKIPYEDRFKPASEPGAMNSSSESSLQQVPEPKPVVETNGVREDSKPPTSSPAANQQSSSATNLSGLVCNVHKCTGKEPHGLVGATTTILGDKLYVFGGRILSRRRPHLSSNMYELDLIRRHWTKLQTSGDIPAPRYFHSVCALGDSKLICYGGMSPVNHKPGAQSAGDPNGEMAVMSDIHVFDAPSRVWTHIPTGDTPPGRYAHCAAVLATTATFSSSNAPMSAILHNPPSSANQGSLGKSIDGAGGAEMIVVGGQDSNNKYIDAISVFNLRSLKWTDTQSLPRSCGAYRSVVTPLVGLPPSRIGKGPDDGDECSSGLERGETAASMLIYSNYNFLDVKLELQLRMPNGSLDEKPMRGPISPPGLRFPNGDVLNNHFIVSGTYLTSSKHEYALWALDLRTLEWSRIDAGGNVFSQGSWNRGILWSRRNTFVILGNRDRSLVDDYNHRRINFSNICMVELEAFGLYDNPRRIRPASNYTSISSPILPNSLPTKMLGLGGRPLTSAAIDLGAMAMNIRDLADMDLLAIGGERIPVNSHILARRWGPYFTKLLRESGSSASIIQNDTSSSSDGGTLRPTTFTSASFTSRNSSITITPSINTTHSIAPSSITAVSSNSASTITASSTQIDPPTPQNLPASNRARQLYLPHTLLTLRALVHYLYTSSLPTPNHHLCTPQILCSLLQLSRPYRIDGLLEATVERLHQILDGRNAAAVFNAAAMAAGGGRGTGFAFGREGLLDADFPLSSEDLTLPNGRFQPRNSTGSKQFLGSSALHPALRESSTEDVAATSANPAASSTEPGKSVKGGTVPSTNASESEAEDTASEISSGGVSSTSSVASSASPSAADASGRGSSEASHSNENKSAHSATKNAAAEKKKLAAPDGSASASGSRKPSTSGLDDADGKSSSKAAHALTGIPGANVEIWAGGLSCVVGLQKRGLRGLMEGRRIREKERAGGANASAGGSLSGPSSGQAGSAARTTVILSPTAPAGGSAPTHNNGGATSTIPPSGSTSTLASNAGTTASSVAMGAMGGGSSTSLGGSGSPAAAGPTSGGTTGTTTDKAAAAAGSRPPGQESAA